MNPEETDTVSEFLENYLHDSSDPRLLNFVLTGIQVKQPEKFGYYIRRTLELAVAHDNKLLPGILDNCGVKVNVDDLFEGEERSHIRKVLIPKVSTECLRDYLDSSEPEGGPVELREEKEYIRKVLKDRCEK